MRCVVIGAGIVGICSALALQRDGHDVVVIDRNGPGEGASRGNAGIFAYGHVVPIGAPGMLKRVPRMLFDSDSPLAIRWSYLPRLAPWLARLLAASTPSRVEALSQALKNILAGAPAAYEPLLRRAGAESLIRRQGWLMLFESEASRLAARPDLELRRQHGVRLEALAESAVRDMVRGLRPGPIAGVMMSDCEHTIDPYRLTIALAETFMRDGGTIRAADARIDLRPNGSPRVTAGGHDIAFDTLVIAAGAWSRTLLRGLREDAPLDTERGYHVMLENNIDLQQPLLCVDRKFSVTPMVEGIRLGGTVEFAGLDAPPNRKRVDMMTRAAGALFPGLKTAPRSTWMGFRPSMPDSLPVIGRSSRHPNVFFAFGHGHLGLTLAAVTGDVIADLVAGRTPALDIAPYRVNRF